MRLFVLLAGTSLLAACGGSGTTSVGSAGSTPTGSGTPAEHTFVAPTLVKTYKANGVAHKYTYKTEIDNISGGQSGQYDQLYAGDATTVRNSGMSITYNPRDAIFDVAVASSASGVSVSTRFQDPAHRTDFNGAVTPQDSTPQLSLNGIQYLEVATGTNTMGNIPGRLGLPVSMDDPTGSYDITTFFYQKPGTTTKYVTYAGFLRNQLSATRVDTAATATEPATSITTNTFSLSRGAFVYGENTLNSDVPTSGNGSFSGDMLATAVLNDQIDTVGFSAAPTYFQWIEGSANVNVNFGANTFALDLTGTTFGPLFDVGTNGNHSIKSGAAFGATGSGRIDLVSTGGFLGQFQKAWFINPNNVRFDLLIAGSSIDGAFYGPKAEEVGGSYRIVGGTPDERIDILGVFTGKK